jgi:NADPH:quinone reductase-like Zn-dependent oxidoreductase
MKAIQVSEPGGPEVLRLVDLPDPNPGPGQALVRLSAIGVNFVDTYHRGGLYPRAVPFVPGAEGAGGQASGPVPPLDLARLQSGGSLHVTRPTLAHFVSTPAELLGRGGDILGRVADGTLSVHIGARYPLADAARAHEDLHARRTTGKVLLIP